MTHLGAFKKVIKSCFKQSAIFRPQILNQPPQIIKTKNLQYDLDVPYSFQALIICPDHRAAGANRQRVRSAVEELDSASLHRIDLKRDTVATIPDSNPALRRAKKEAYFQVTNFTKLD